MKTWIAIAAIAAALSFGAASAEAAPSVAKACAKDVKTLCPDVKSGGGKLKACVSEHYRELSEDCQIAIVKAAAPGRACKADIKKFCADVKPGKNRIAECVKSHAADLSDGCKDALTKAEAGSK